MTRAFFVALALLFYAYTGADAQTPGPDWNCNWTTTCKNLGIQGVPYSTTAPTSGQVYQFNATNGDMEPGAIGSVQGIPYSAVSPATGQVYQFNGAQMAPASPPGSFSGTPIAGDCVSVANSSGVLLDAGAPCTTSASGVPVGASIPYVGATAPAGWLLEYGQCVSTTTYSALYAVAADIWTAADGCVAGTFGIPDMRGRATFGADNMGGVAAGRLGAGVSGGITGTAALGASGGEQKHVLTNSEVPPTPIATSGGAVATQAGSGYGNGGSNVGGPDVSVRVGGGGSAHNNTPPAMVMNFIVKY